MYTSRESGIGFLLKNKKIPQKHTMYKRNKRYGYNH